MGAEFRSWGVMYDPNNRDIPHSWDFECLECGWRYHLNDHHECIVGFHLLGIPEIGLTGSKKIGILIVECPECFSKFWLHAREITAEFIREHSTKWPKPPDPNAE